MRSGRVLRVVVCGVLLAACATQRVWTKPDFNEGAWALDRDACVEESRTEVKVPLPPPTARSASAPPPALARA
jgi:hypothetical protein